MHFFKISLIPSRRDVSRCLCNVKQWGVDADLLPCDFAGVSPVS